MRRREMDRKKAFRRFPELETERLILREVTLDDVEWYLKHFSTREIVVGQGFPAPNGIKGARQELEKYFVGLFKDRAGFRWGLQLKGDDNLIGSAGFYRWEKPYGSKAQMGYDLQPEYWGRGIMSEAMRRIVEFGFTKMKLTRMELTVMTRNRRSMRLARAVGFKKEGVLRKYGYDENLDLVDEAMFSLLISDWEKAE